jgi:CheY-like chemotaxis protein
MTRLLVVDDQPEELQATQELLSAVSAAWCIDTAGDGCQALQLATRQEYDVVISDFLMPRMNGFEFLQRLQRHAPRTLRVLLSGSFDWRAMPQSGRAVTDICLNKPCAAQELQQAVLRGLHVRDRLEDERLLRLLASLDPAPTAPCWFRAFDAATQAPRPSLKRLTRILAQEPGLCHRLFELARTQWACTGQPLDDVRDLFHGASLESLKALLLLLDLFREFGAGIDDRAWTTALWESSLAAGQAARRLALSEGLDPVQTAWCHAAGLLRDVGRLVLRARLPVATTPCADQNSWTPSVPDSFWAAEPDQAVTDAEFGALLLRHWGVPFPVIEATALHRRQPMNEALILQTAPALAIVLRTRALAPTLADAFHGNLCQAAFRPRQRPPTLTADGFLAVA